MRLQIRDPADHPLKIDDGGALRVHELPAAPVEGLDVATVPPHQGKTGQSDHEARHVVHVPAAVVGDPAGRIPQAVARQQRQRRQQRVLEGAVARIAQRHDERDQRDAAHGAGDVLDHHRRDHDRIALAGERQHAVEQVADRRQHAEHQHRAQQAEAHHEHAAEHRTGHRARGEQRLDDHARSRSC